MRKTCLDPIPVSLRDGSVFFYPCGRCPNCRDLARSQIAARIWLEYSVHRSERDIFFLTLTYDDLHNPGRPFKDHIDNFLQDLRNDLRRSDITVRYILVSEYGDLDNRPHYHFVALTSKKCPYGSPGRVTPDGYTIYPNRFVDAVRDCWPYGFVDDGGTPSPAAVLYTVGYALKEDQFSVEHDEVLREIWRLRRSRKNLSRSQMDVLSRKPFNRFSLRPGIGLDDETVDFVLQYVYNDGTNFRLNLDLGGIKVPLPRIYLDKFTILQGDPFFSELLTRLRTYKFETVLQEDLSFSYDRCCDGSLARRVKMQRIDLRHRMKQEKVYNSLLNKYRNELPKAWKSSL